MRNSGENTKVLRLQIAGCWGPILQNTLETAQVYAILVDISHLMFGGSLTLGLSTTNRTLHYLRNHQSPNTTMEDT